MTVLPSEPGKAQRRLSDAAGTGLLGVVLAGGRSSRMGRDKALLAHAAGTTVLEHQLALLASCVQELAVSVRGRDYAEPLARIRQQCGITVRLLEDVTAEIGPLGGLVTALEAAGSSGFAGILVLSCDMPLLTLGILARLVEAWEEERALVTAVQETSGRMHPLVAVWSVQALGSLQAAVSRGDYALRRAVARDAWQAVRLPPHEEALLVNVNTEQDWLAVQGILAGQQGQKRGDDLI